VKSAATVSSAVRLSKEDKAAEIARRKEERKQVGRENNCYVSPSPFTDRSTEGAKKC
jgi:hypothetical protein